VTARVSRIRGKEHSRTRDIKLQNTAALTKRNSIAPLIHDQDAALEALRHEICLRLGHALLIGD
jgi:hypothetical protein